MGCLVRIASSALTDGGAKPHEEREVMAFRNWPFYRPDGQQMLEELGH